MSKPSPDPASYWHEEIRAAFLDQTAFVRATIGFKENTTNPPCTKAIMRPVIIRKNNLLQISMFYGKKDISRNFLWQEGVEEFEKLLMLPFQHIHIHTTMGDLQGRRTRKGKLLISRTAPTMAGKAICREHNRQKIRPFSEQARDPFFRVIGLSDAEGLIIPQMRSKFRQINQFLGILENTIPKHSNRQLHILDCGSGSAWLTFSAYHYLHDILRLPVRLTGIDNNQEVIEKSRSILNRLGWNDVAFHLCPIDQYQPDEKPDVVISLHACNTATDAAIALGVLQGSDVILAAPCCQHELHHQLKNPIFRPVLQQGILRERMADILTDTLRAQILGIMGYKTTVMEFIDPAETTKNLLIQARKTENNRKLSLIEEYQALCRFWSIKPTLEGMLKNYWAEALSSRQKQNLELRGF